MKIICKALALRLIPVMKQLVHKDQCVFIPTHSTAMNIRRLMHVLHAVEDREEELALVSIDIAKAFDTAHSIDSG